MDQPVPLILEGIEAALLFGPDNLATSASVEQRP